MLDGISRGGSAALQSRLDSLLRWDAELLRLLHSYEHRPHAQQWLNAAMRGFTRAGDTAGWLVHCAVMLVMPGVALASIVAMASSAVLATAASQLAKWYFRRARPAVAIPGFVARAAAPDPFSFPSGHSSVAFAVATAAVATDPALGAIEAPLAFLIACSRVWLGAHYPVDAIGGAALGFACGLVVWMVAA